MVDLDFALAIGTEFSMFILAIATPCILLPFCSARCHRITIAHVELRWRLSFLSFLLSPAFSITNVPLSTALQLSCSSSVVGITSLPNHSVFLCL
jgi:hypothetical protein